MLSATSFGFSIADSDVINATATRRVEQRTMGTVKELVYQGAEARLFKVEFMGEEALLKERFPKAYRHPELEARLTKSRLSQEVRTCARATRAGVLTPTIFHVDAKSNTILMEFVRGRCLREVFADDVAGEEAKLEIAAKLGAEVAKLHNAGLVHGDLTTSNAMTRESDGALVLIDFGLSKPNANVEDKAVDMYVLERAFSSTHPGSEALFERVLAAYAAGLTAKERPKVLDKLKQVQQRGRKREMIG